MPCFSDSTGLNTFVYQDTEPSPVLPKDEKWLRPAKIHPSGSHVYEPDFVVETIDTVYIVEIKAHNRVDDNDVKLKAKAAREYCKNVNAIFAETGKKPWKYMLLLDSEIARNSDFSQLEREIEYHSFV